MDICKTCLAFSLSNLIYFTLLRFKELSFVCFYVYFSALDGKYIKILAFFRSSHGWKAYLKL